MCSSHIATVLNVEFGLIDNKWPTLLVKVG